MSYIINRKEAEEIKKGNAWLLIYGRRKTGKTFLLKQLCKFENYYLVKKNLEILFRENNISIKQMISNAKADLEKNKTVVIDEFQRLKESDIEELTTMHPKGRLIISGSSFRIIKKIFEPNSALLGFFTPYKIGFINPFDIANALKKKINPVQAIELSAFLREPWLIPLFNNKNAMRFIYEIINMSKYIIISLIGEIFNEETRKLTKKYEVLLNLIGSGIWNVGEMASIMFSRGLIPNASQTNIIQYLKNMEEIALIESIKLIKSKKHYYRLSSPVANIYYYLDNRYNITAREISFEEIKPTLEKLINLEIQNFFGDYFAYKYNGRKEYFISPEKELDFIITKRNKIEIIGEVKWKKINKKDIEKFKYNCRFFNAKKILICKQRSIECNDNNVQIIDAKNFLNI